MNRADVSPIKAYSRNEKRANIGYGKWKHSFSPSVSSPYLLQIQPILHIVPGQPIPNPTLDQRNKRGDKRAEPEGRRGGPVGGKNIESHGQTGKQAGSHRINSRGYSGKDSADQVEKDSHADKDTHGGQNFMAVEAVADGDTHIVKQDTGHLRQEKQRNFHKERSAKGYAVSLPEAAKQVGNLVKNSGKHSLVQNHRQDRKGYEQEIHRDPDHRHQELAQNLLVDRYGEGVHQVTLIGKEVLPEPQNRQVDGGNQPNGYQGDDIEDHQGNVRKVYPHISHIEGGALQGQLDIKASDKSDTDKPQVKRDHQPVHRFKFVFD